MHSFISVGFRVTGLVMLQLDSFFLLTTHH